MTSGEFAIARATRSASSSPAAPRTSIRPTRGRALAVGDDLQRELQQHRLEQSGGKRPAPGAARLQQHRVVRAHLAVDGDPLERAGDGCAQRRVGIGDDGIRLHEAEHRRVARLDHPGALRLGGEGDAAGADAAALRARVGRHDRRREVLAAVGPQRRRGAVDAAEHLAGVERNPDRPGLGDGDGGGIDAERGRAALLHRDGVGVTLLAGRGVGVPGVDDGGADRARRRSDRGRPGPERRRRRCGSTAAPRRPGASQATIPTSVPPDSFRPQAGPAARKPGASAVGRCSSTPAGGSTQRDRKKPGHSSPHLSPPSSRPSIRLRF